MPQEREHQFPYPTAAEVDAAPGDPATKAARNIMVRNITGIPRRAFLMGDNDAAPILQGVADLTAVCYRLAEALGNQEKGTVSADTHAAWGDMLTILGHHGCPEKGDAEPTPGN